MIGMGQGWATRLGHGAAVALLLCLAATAAQAAGSCAGAGTDDTVRPIPQTLVPAARRAFGLRRSDADIARTTVFRCVDSRVLLCTAGANLPCGKANTARSLPPADAYCRAHPDSAVIPMVVTGHDTPFRWRCVGPAAEASAAEAVDPQGFIARVWKPAD